MEYSNLNKKHRVEAHSLKTIHLLSITNFSKQWQHQQQQQQQQINQKNFPLKPVYLPGFFKIN